MQDAIVIKPFVADQVKNAMIHGRVIFFSAPCGFGKTTTAWALLEGKKVYFAAAGEPGFRLPLLRETWDVLLLDQLQNLPEEEQEPLCELIRRSPNRRFFLLSRGTPPGWLIHFQFSGLMLVLDTRALLFDRDSTAKLLRLMGGDPTDLEVTAIQRESLGYPLAVSMIGREMANGSPYSPEIDAKVRRELYIHYETAVYRRFDLPIRRFLLEISPFTTFDIELARMVTGDSAVGEVIDWLQRNTSMLQYDGIQRFHFWDIFRNFLQWEMDREYTPEKQRAIFDRGGLYYELNGQSALALECYTKAGDHAKVSDLLTRNAECHPGTGHYEEMERYYRALPEEEILVSPALMQAMCMLCALEMEYEESERWYQALADFAARCERTDAARKQARSRLAWLDIALPQRGVTGLIDTIPKVFRLLTNREIALGNSRAALLTLAALEPYFTACQRHIDGIHLHLLMTIARHRLKDETWSQALCQALDTAAEYHFLRPVSCYGASILPLLERCGWPGDPAFLKQSVAYARVQAANYPDFLRLRLSPAESLTSTELQVLKLLCADRSNAEIGAILDIKLATVKSHVSHILQKLGVKRRSEAKTVAEELWLL